MTTELRPDSALAPNEEGRIRRVTHLSQTLLTTNNGSLCSRLWCRQRKKPRQRAQRLDTLGWNDSRILFVTGRDAFQENFQRSCGNLQGTQSKTAVDVTVHDALKYSRVVADLPALEYFEERLRKGSTMPVPDSRKSITMRSLRQERRTAAIGKMAQLADKLVRLQYEGRFGESLPPIPLRLSSASEI